MFESMTYQIALTPVQFLLPSENVDMSNVECLMEDICRCGCWTTPVPIEKDTGIIMDGNHRLRAATELGLKHIPCALLDYDDPPSIRLSLEDRAAFLQESNYEDDCGGKEPVSLQDHAPFFPARAAVGACCAG
ncbi:ParB N-terminal domain-containing protein [Pectobacterium versatile]|uniref:ParB N-terminal domain-containing protein n=1 Tax=Pectobacterium versatile TaxID=2488639 RepID=UPI001F20D850|nr:ParB N-terminal domain-containing protein [Pectobacterium versatile]